MKCPKAPGMISEKTTSPTNSVELLGALRIWTLKLVQVVILYNLIFVGNGCKQIPVKPVTKKQTKGTT